MVVKLHPRNVPTLAEYRAAFAGPADSQAHARPKIYSRLAVVERMASLGALAAGVGHEINNPLSAVLANLELLHDELAACADAAPDALAARLAGARPLLDDAREAAELIRTIVRDLNVFSRSPQGKAGKVDVHGVLESTLRMAAYEVRQRARIVRDFGEVPLVHGSQARLGQVMLNLVMNAAQSIRRGDATHNEVRVATSSDAAGRAVVEVSDTGHGIAPEHLPHIFEPFFTTKPEGVGTGLGLSISRDIVLEMGGRIEVRSTVGVGTTFRVTLAPARMDERDGIESCTERAEQATAEAV